MESDYIGVSWNKNKKKWVAVIFQMGSQKHLGYFDSDKNAAIAYDVAARKVNKQTNFETPPEPDPKPKAKSQSKSKSPKSRFGFKVSRKRQTTGINSQDDVVNRKKKSGKPEKEVIIELAQVKGANALKINGLYKQQSEEQNGKKLFKRLADGAAKDGELWLRYSPSPVNQVG